VTNIKFGPSFTNKDSQRLNQLANSEKPKEDLTREDRLLLKRFLAWLSKCQRAEMPPPYVQLKTRSIALPHPEFGYRIGPEDNAQHLGAFFPLYWGSEAMFHGMYKFKVSFERSSVGAEDSEVSFQRSFHELDFRILEYHADESLTVALDIGKAHDMASGNGKPGHYLLPEGQEFVPFALQPALFRFDFRGIAPQRLDRARYYLSAVVTPVWKRVC